MLSSDTAWRAPPYSIVSLNLRSLGSSGAPLDISDPAASDIDVGPFQVLNVTKLGTGSYRIDFDTAGVNAEGKDVSLPD